MLGGQGGGCASGHDDINLERNQFGRKSGEPLELPLSISVFNHDGTALDVAEVTQSVTEGLWQVGRSGQVGPQVAYSSDLGRLLSIGGERRGENTATESREECAPMLYWITSSARPSSDGGIVRPRAFAVFRLMTRSNFVDCSTGRSPGFAPLKILST